MAIFRNSLYSFAGTATPIVVGLITIPLYISAIGLERYGVLAIAWLFLGYFGQADFGIGRAITQRIASTPEASPTHHFRMLIAALASAAMVSLIGSLFIYASAYWYLSGPFEIGDELREEAISSIWVLALCNPIVAISGVLSGALIGLERFKLPSFANMVGSSLLQILPLVYAMTTSSDVSALIVCAMAGRIVALLLLAIGVQKQFFVRKGLALDWQEVRKLTKFGVWIMVSALISPLMIFSDRLVIGWIAGAVAVAAYSIPFQMAARAQIVPIMVVQALFPRFANEDMKASGDRCRNYTIFVGQMFAPLVIGLICLAGPLLELWLGEGLDRRSVSIGQILLLGFWLNAVANVPYAFIQARGNSRFTALLHLLELPFYGLLLFTLGYYFGLDGVAAAFGLRCLVDCTSLILKSGVGLGAILQSLWPQIFLLGASVSIMQASIGWIEAFSAAILIAGLSSMIALFMMPPIIAQRIKALPYVGRLVFR